MELRVSVKGQEDLTGVFLPATWALKQNSSTHKTLFQLIEVDARVNGGQEWN